MFENKPNFTTMPLFRVWDFYTELLKMRLEGS